MLHPLAQLHQILQNVLGSYLLAADVAAANCAQQVPACWQNPPEEKEEKRKDYVFSHQFNEKPSIIPGCPGRTSLNKGNTQNHMAESLAKDVTYGLRTKPKVLGSEIIDGWEDDDATRLIRRLSEQSP